MGNDKTKWIFDDEPGDGGGELRDYGPTLPDDPMFQREDFDDTRTIRSTEQTVIYHSGSAGKLRTDFGVEGSSGPVVGFLVVQNGPGCGQALSLGVGVNSIGRDPSERVAVSYGDMLISAKDHARIYYDDESRTFYITHGSGKNLTRVNGAVVANPVPLESHAVIQLTKVTHLRFVPVCGPDFDWGDLDQKGDDSAK